MSVQQVGSPSVVRLGFGPFELNVAERSLKKANRNIPLGGRAYDILIALLENAGETVSKAELIAKVWPDVTVEEGGLRVHLSALRKALGDGQFGDKYIANIQGHGYRFIAPVTRLPAERDRDSASAGLSNLPPALGRMVGRDDVVPEIRSWLRTGQRLITVLGAGGMGKTTVALAVARQASADFSGAAFFVDLSAVSDKEQVIGAVASAIGLDLRFADPEKALLDFLRPRRALIILDSCEHLIKKTAEIADTVLQNASGIHMLATSREALQVAGERVLRLRPLDCPPEQPGLTASQVLAYPAAQLFVERVSARGGDCSLSDDEAPIVARFAASSTESRLPSSSPPAEPLSSASGTRWQGLVRVSICSNLVDGQQIRGIKRSKQRWIGATTTFRRSNEWCCGASQFSLFTSRWRPRSLRYGKRG